MSLIQDCHAVKMKSELPVAVALQSFPFLALPPSPYPHPAGGEGPKTKEEFLEN